jgi:phosphoribosylformimino-5-aminoimidazole carboxamide ribotide isomerase
VVVGSALVKNDKIDTDFAAGISKEVGRDKLVFAVDTKHGLLAYEGWRKTAPISVEDAIPQLNDFCGAFLHSHVETEGGMGGFPANVVRELVKLTHNQLIVGGGVKSLEEVQELDALGADAIVGMAVYKGVIPV